MYPIMAMTSNTTHTDYQRRSNMAINDCWKRSSSYSILPPFKEEPLYMIETEFHTDRRKDTFTYLKQLLKFNLFQKLFARQSSDCGFIANHQNSYVCILFFILDPLNILSNILTWS